MTQHMSLEAASQALREAMRDTVKKHSTWYLIQGGLMVVAGILALLYPLLSSVALVIFLGWLLIITGVLQGISLIGAQHVPHFWLQLVSVALSLVIGFLFVAHPGAGVITLVLLLVVFFIVEGISKIVFSLDDPTVSELGLGPGERGARHRARGDPVEFAASRCLVPGTADRAPSLFLKASRSAIWPGRSAGPETFSDQLTPRAWHAAT